MTSLGVLGAGGQAREIADFSPFPVAYFAVNSAHVPPSRMVAGIRVIDLGSPADVDATVPVVAGVGPPGLRRRLVGQWRGRFTSVVSPLAYVARSARIDQGTIVAPSAVLMSSVHVSAHCLINAGATIGHDTVLGEYATVSPGASIGGMSRIGAGVFIGIGATVSHRVTIGEGTVVGAGAVVVHDLEADSVYAGVPARRLGPGGGWLDHL